ncbi:MAG: thioredoxin fold domain-containing protein [Flavobacteriales bacterium]|nr:thioredoxin fold domain-containing protein [Flavobacteriales bacterium]NUM51887.1 thioredoxin fold domain-containing protein [Flavobacteriales bacterium]
MKKITFLFLAFLSLSILALKNKTSEETKSINWVSFEEAIKLQEKTPKKIIVDVYTVWCGPCKMMMANTFTHPYIIDYINKNYYAVKFNAEGPDDVTVKGHTFKNPNYNPERANSRNGTHELASSIAAVNGSIAYPTLVYFDEKLNIMQAIQGYQTPQQLEPILKFFGEDHYKTTKWEVFYSTFKTETK